MNIRYEYPMGVDELEPVALGYLRLMMEENTLVMPPMIGMTIQAILGECKTEAPTEEGNWDVTVAHLQPAHAPIFEDNKPTILVSSFLATPLPQEWKPFLDQAAGIIVPGEDIAVAYRAMTDTPVLAIPLPLPPMGGSDKRPVPESLVGKKYLMWSGPSGMMSNLAPLVKAYYNAVPEKSLDKYTLVLSTNGPLAGADGSPIDVIKAAKRELNFRGETYPSIQLFDGTEMPIVRQGLLQNAHAFVSFSMDDPFAIHVKNAVSAGIPVVSTGYKQLGGLINVPVNSGEPVLPYPELALDPKTMSWDMPDLTQLTSTLQKLLEDQEFYSKLEKASQEVCQAYADRLKPDTEVLTNWLTEISDSCKENEEPTEDGIST